MKKCDRCGYEKTWDGDGINCPFKSGDVFSSDNWNCGMINGIRDLCDLAMEGKDYRLHYQYCDDQKYACINTNVVSEGLLENDDYEYMGECLWVSWYKNRGGTDSMWLLSSGEEPKKPTFDQLQQIINFYKTNN